MKVFVAGATGAIGRPLVSALIEAGHEVTGMTHSEKGVIALREQGARAAAVDAFDFDGVNAALREAKPEVVIEELTSLPKQYAVSEIQSAAIRDRKLRWEGGMNLQNAARAAGVRRYLVQSSGFWYAPGPGLAAETESFAFNSPPTISGSAHTFAQVEQRVREAASEMETVILRYGFFYGPGTWYSEDGSVGDQVRGRKYPIAAGGHGVWSFVHVDDAAAATVAAVEGPPGIYNVVDDQPSELRVWLTAFARSIGAPDPPTVSEADALREAGADFVYFAACLRGASNVKARQVLGFSPRPLEWTEQAHAE